MEEANSNPRLRLKDAIMQEKYFAVAQVEFPIKQKTKFVLVKPSQKSHLNMALNPSLPLLWHM